MACKVTIQGESGGANRIDDDLPCAVFGAVGGSGVYTMRAFVIGLIAHAVLEEVFDGSDMQRLKIFLTGVHRPANVAKSVELALSGRARRNEFDGPDISRAGVYLTCPACRSPIPQDGGEKYGAWKHRP